MTPHTSPGAAAGDPRTAYEVLGVARTASAEELRRAYRAAARRTHPDAGGDARDFRAVVRAWEAVGDPEARRRYDLSLPSAGESSTVWLASGSAAQSSVAATMSILSAVTSRPTFRESSWAW